MKSRESLHYTVVLCSVLNIAIIYIMIVLFKDEETWLWTLLTDPQVVAAIIGFIGVVITTCQCCKLVLHTC